MKYDWVNYSTAIGMEIFYKLIYPESLDYFKEKILDNQVQYDVRVFQVDTKGFHRVDIQALREQREQKRLSQEALANP